METVPLRLWCVEVLWNGTDLEGIGWRDVGWLGGQEKSAREVRGHEADRRIGRVGFCEAEIKGLGVLEVKGDEIKLLWYFRLGRTHRSTRTMISRTERL